MSMQERLSRYIDQRFGMFIHYNMNTYFGGWGENRVDPKTFATPSLGRPQWRRDRPGTSRASPGLRYFP